MKKIISAVCAGLIGFSAFAYDITENTKLYGSVKSVTKTTYTISQKFGDYFRTPNAKIVTVYDGAGRQVESTELTPRDAVVNKVQCVYDVTGNLVEQNAYDSEGVLFSKSISTYSNGRKTDVSEYSKDGSLKNKIIFNYTGVNPTDETYYDSEGAMIRKIIYAYNIQGQIEKISEYYGDGLLDEERTYEWGTNGKIDSITTTYGDDSVSKDVYRYTNNILTEVTTYNGENVITSRLLVKCDSIGNITKLTTYTVAKKFGQVLNEMTDMVEYTYQY